jgi:hypothetical protein
VVELGVADGLRHLNLLQGVAEAELAQVGALLVALPGVGRAVVAGAALFQLAENLLQRALADALLGFGRDVEAALLLLVLVDVPFFLRSSMKLPMPYWSSVRPYCLSSSFKPLQGLAHVAGGDGDELHEQLKQRLKAFSG